MFLTPSNIAGYEARLKDGVLANKERGEQNFIPLQSVERFKIPSVYFQKLEEALGYDGLDLQYAFRS